MHWWAVALLVPAVFIALGEWRNGLFAVLVVGFLQDPFRKLELGRPVYFTLFVGVVFIAAYLKAQVRMRFVPGQIPGWKGYLAFPGAAFAFLLAAQAGNSLVRYGNPVIAGIGAISYLAPLPALLAGYHFAIKDGRAGIERWLLWYTVISVTALVSVWLQYAGADWPVLGDVGSGFVLYQEDTILTANSGFFRASEVAAWHTATAVCVVMLLSSLHRISTTRVVAVICLIVVLLAIGVLTGRRKIFVEVVIFLCVYVALLMRFGKGGTKLALATVVGGFAIFAVVNLWVSESPVDVSAAKDIRFQRYAERGASVRSDVLDRFKEIGLDPISDSIDRFGWLGGGLGVGSQGAQHFGGGAGVFGGGAEGGLGKITSELGIAGLAIVIWLAVAVVRFAWKIVTFVAAKSSSTARLSFGIVAFLIANLAVFTINTQIFGDMFILLMLGLMTGFFLATPVLASREHAERVRARQATLHAADGLVAAR